MIAVNQLNQSQLAAFILANTSGGNFSGILGGYLAGGGYLGENVVYSSGGAQEIAGSKSFLTNPTVPYSGGTGTSPSQRWVSDSILYYVNSLSGTITGSYVLLNGNQTINDYKVFTGAVGVGAASLGIHAATLAQLSGASGILSAAGGAAVSGVLNTTIFNTGAAAVSFATTYGNSIGASVSGALTATGQALSAVKVTGSAINNVVNFTGLGGTLVFTSGGFTFISGAAGGGGGTVTQGQLDALSGALGASGTQLYVLLTGASGQFNANFATALNLALSGSNLYQTMTGMSGALVSRGLAISGALQTLITASTGGTTNVYNATGSGIITVTGSAPILSGDFSGVGGTLVYTLGNQILISGAGSSAPAASTNNQTTLSFYFDQYNLATGLNQVEAFVARDFVFTGFALGVINSGTQGYFSGSLYQRTPLNTKTNFVNFSLNNGAVYTGVGGYAQSISGQNRIGVDVYLIGTGITGLSIGVFGTGT